MVLALVPFGASVGLAGAAPPVRVSGDSPFRDCATAASYVNAEVEPSLAADPRHPQRLVAVYQQDRYHGGGARGIVAAVSTNGGRAWRRGPLQVTSCAGPAARQSPFASDPWVSVGPDGRIYAAALSDVVTVVTSANWGMSWSPPAIVDPHTIPDKESVTADPLHAGTAYVVWSDYHRTNPPATESDELLSVTHDGGKTWSAAKLVLGRGSRAGPEDGQILVDPRNGRLYLFTAWVRDGVATAAEPAWMLIQRSTDGGVQWSKARRFATGSPARRHPGPVIRSSPQVPSFAIDGRGVLYAVWQDARFTDGRVEQLAFTSSHDGGLHWSRPRRVGKSSTAGSIIPTVAAQGRGLVAVLYLQLQGRSTTLTGRYRVATSRNGGKSFDDRVVSRTFTLTDAPLLTAGPLVPGGYFLGDYMGATPIGGGSFGTLSVVAASDDANKTDVFYAPAGTR